MIGQGSLSDLAGPIRVHFNKSFVLFCFLVYQGTPDRTPPERTSASYSGSIYDSPYGRS